ncbi:MAG: N-formylglutamate amidohydrolase [Promethearchaeota archaeon]
MKVVDNDSEFAEYVRIRPGTIPVVLNASHGGDVEPPGIPRRASGRLARDVGTVDFARALRRACASVTVDGRSLGTPWLVACRLRRAFVDLNRTPDEGAEHPHMREFHDYYYAKLSSTIEALLAASPKCLLLDVHGFDSRKRPLELRHVDVFLGTLQGATTSSGGVPDPARVLLAGSLTKAGFAVSPGAPLERELVFQGGNLIDHFGRDERVVAIQVELSERARFRGYTSKKRLLAVLAEFLGEWLETVISRNFQ